jgi:hypothetical protein
MRIPSADTAQSFRTTNRDIVAECINPMALIALQPVHIAQHQRLTALRGRGEFRANRLKLPALVSAGKLVV